MKKFSLFLAFTFILGCANFAFGQCTITGNFENGQEVNGSLINNHSLSLIKGKKFYVEVNIKNLSNIGGYNPFKIYFPNTRNDLSNPGLTDFRGMILTGILKDEGNVAYSFGADDYSENDWQRTRELTLDTLSVESKQIRVLVSSGTHPRGKYTIKVYSEGCGTNGSVNTGSGNSGSSNNSSGSNSSGSNNSSSNNSGSNKPKKPENSDNDGSIDIGRVILDKIKENRDKNKKPKDNSGGNSSNSGNNNSNNFGNGVTIFEGKNQSGTSATFGVGTYRADYGPIKAIGNDTASSIIVENDYRVKICQNEGDNNQGSGNCEEYGAGNYNLKYDNQASWIKVWKDGNSSRNDNSSSNSGNSHCVFKETFTIPQGQNGYIKDYPVSLGNGTYRVEFAQNLNRDVMFPGFGIGLFDNRKDPKGEHRAIYISGASWGKSVQGSHPSIAYWTHATPNQPEREYRAGEFAKSDDFTNKNYTTLRISYWQGVGAGPGATGKYEVRIIGPGCSSGSSSSSGNNNPPVSNPPQNDVPFDPNNQTKVKIALFNPEKTSGADCLQGAEDVTISVTKRPAMLRAALEELIRYPANKNGYLNYTTTVLLQDVKLENGTALIYLSGSLEAYCVRNRILYQLGRTARQFSTVKNVQIFLNNSEVGYQ